jgi:hypothetical protein
MKLKNILIGLSCTEGHSLSESDYIVWVAASFPLRSSSHATVFHAEKAWSLALRVWVAHVIAEAVRSGLREGLVHRSVRRCAHRELLAVK